MPRNLRKCSRSDEWRDVETWIQVEHTGHYTHRETHSCESSLEVVEFSLIEHRASNSTRVEVSRRGSCAVVSRGGAPRATDHRRLPAAAAAAAVGRHAAPTDLHTHHAAPVAPSALRRWTILLEFFPSFCWENILIFIRCKPKNINNGFRLKSTPRSIDSTFSNFS